MYTSLAIGATLVASFFVLGVLGGILAFAEDFEKQRGQRFNLFSWIATIVVTSCTSALAVWLWQKAVA